MFIQLFAYACTDVHKGYAEDYEWNVLCAAIAAAWQHILCVLHAAINSTMEGLHQLCLGLNMLSLNMLRHQNTMDAAVSPVSASSGPPGAAQVPHPRPPSSC